MTERLTADQMNAARVAILSRIISRLSYRRYLATLPYPSIDICERDVDTREIVAAMLDLTPDALAVALDKLEATAPESWDHATQARFTLAQIPAD